jgi:hypothetical protein
MSAQGPDSPAGGAGLRARLGQLLRDRGAVAPGDSAASGGGAKALGSGLRRNDDERERGTSQASTHVGEPATSVLTKTGTLVARASTLVGGIAANLSASAIAAQVDSLRQLQRTREAQRRAAESALPGIALSRGVRLISAEVPLPDVTARRCADFASAPTWEAHCDAPTAPLVFFDTETTGLAGGTGTLVFLLGIAWIADARLHLRQFPAPNANGSPRFARRCRPRRRSSRSTARPSICRCSPRASGSGACRIRSPATRTGI